MKKKIQDERILTGKRKIQSDAFQVIWLLLIISTLVQQYIYQAPLEQYIVELLLFIVMSVYIIIASIRIGDVVFPSKKGIIINSLVSGTIVTIIITTFNYLNYAGNTQPLLHIAIVAGLTFVINTPCIFLVFYVIYLMSKKRQESIDKKLNDDDI